jgi:hypothetical protein
MSATQETVNGVTFEPSTLFFVLVGVDMEGEPFESESWLHPQPKDFASAEEHAKGILKRASLVTFVRIQSYISDECSVRVKTVWR